MSPFIASIFTVFPTISPLSFVTVRFFILSPLISVTPVRLPILNPLFSNSPSPLIIVFSVPYILLLPSTSSFSIVAFDRYIFGTRAFFPFTVSYSYHIMSFFKLFICSFVSATPCLSFKSSFAVVALSISRLVSSLPDIPFINLVPSFSISVCSIKRLS